MNTIYVVVEGTIENNAYLKGKEFEIVPSFYDIKKSLEKDSVMVTYDASIFSFCNLKKGVDVVLLKKNEYIRLSELLENKYNYTQKEMRPAHNAFKMFVAGAFNWRSLKIENNLKNF